MIIGDPITHVLRAVDGRSSQLSVACAAEFVSITKRNVYFSTYEQTQEECCSSHEECSSPLSTKWTNKNTYCIQFSLDAGTVHLGYGQTETGTMVMFVNVASVQRRTCVRASTVRLE